MVATLLQDNAALMAHRVCQALLQVWFRVMVIFSWHILSNFSISLLQDIVKDPKFILGGATRTDICQGDLGEWFPLGGCVHVHTPWGAAAVSSHRMGCCPSQTAGSSEAGGPAQAHSYLLDSSLPSMPGTILVQWDSGSEKDLHPRIMWPKGVFHLPAPPDWSTVCPGQAGTPSLGTHRLSFGFQRKWQLTVITSPLASFLPSFPLLHPQVTAGYWQP